MKILLLKQLVKINLQIEKVKNKSLHKPTWKNLPSKKIQNTSKIKYYHTNNLILSYNNKIQTSDNK